MDISGIGGPKGPGPINPYNKVGAGAGGPSGPTRADSVAVSEGVLAASRAMSRTPDVREDKVAAAKENLEKYRRMDDTTASGIAEKILDRGNPLA